MNYQSTLLPICMVAMVGCSEKAATKRPNIIVIMTDDHTTQALSCYGQSPVATPNLDRIANEGMRMNACYVSNAISGPSRACILTGKLSHVNGFTDNSQTFDGNQQTFPKLLQKAGYQTAMIGKWHLNSDPQGFDYWSILAGQGEYYSPLFKENGKEVVEPGYVTDIITDKAISFLNNRDTSRPFAMLFYHKAPHRNWMPAQRHLGIYDSVTFPEPVNLLDTYRGRGKAASEQMMSIATDMWPEWDLKLVSPDQISPSPTNGTNPTSANANHLDVSRANDRQAGIRQFSDAYMRMDSVQRAAWNRAYAPRIAEYRNSKLQGDALTRWKYQQYMRDYYATIKSVDESVGKLLDYLKSIGQIDNTIIIYTSDQGFFLGEHGWFDKRFMYEECQRTPLMVRYPKAIKAGTQSDALTMNIDIAPTILEYAGVAIPTDIQGRSLKEVLDNSGTAPEDWRTGVYYHYYEYPSWHMVKRHYGIRTRDYKLIHFYNDIDQWELYDIKRDPHEMQNQYDNPEYAAIRKQMHQQLEQLQTQYGDTDPCELKGKHFESYNSL